MPESGPDGTIYTFSARGLEFPAAIAVVYQSLLMPEMQSGGYTLSADEQNVIKRQYTISYQGIPASVPHGH